MQAGEARQYAELGCGVSVSACYLDSISTLRLVLFSTEAEADASEPTEQPADPMRNLADGARDLGPGPRRRRSLGRPPFRTSIDAAAARELGGRTTDRE